MKEWIKRIPIVGAVSARLYRRWKARAVPLEPFPGSQAYWEKRYASGGNSGPGSQALLAEFKADVLNRFVDEHRVRSVVEFGCGDGNQLARARYPSYLGFDVSPTAVARCRALFAADPSKRFRTMDEYDGETAELSLSLDVIYHLVEDDVFERYMHTLFGASLRYVVVYASDTDDNRGYEGTHVRHRKFSAWIRDERADFRLIEHVPNRYPYEGDWRRGSFAEFFVYEKA